MEKETELRGKIIEILVSQSALTSNEIADQIMELLKDYINDL